MNSLEDIRRQLDHIAAEQASSRTEIAEIKTALIGNPMDANKPGMVNRVHDHGRRIDAIEVAVEPVESHGRRIKAIEAKQRRVIGWALAGIGTVVTGALYAFGAYVVELFKGDTHPPGGH